MSVKPLKKTWRNLRGFLLNERSHFEKGTYCNMIPAIGYSEKAKLERHKLISCCQGCVRMDRRQSTEDF